MALQRSSFNDVNVYNVTKASRSALPDWLANKNKNSLKKDTAWRNRIELIQDFGFPEASLRIKATRDGEFIAATGVYKPQMRIFELRQMSMKFDRHTDAENVQFEILSDDWKKMVFLQSDRSIEFHNQGGIHFRARIPRFGRDLAYHPFNCDVLTVGASSEIYRLNLQQGRFLAPFQSEAASLNVITVNPAHQLYGVGSTDSHVEFYDPRTRNKVGRLNVLPAFVPHLNPLDAVRVPEISSFAFHDDGLTYAVGSSTGQVALYDLRHSTPLHVKDHQYGFPIKKIEFHASDRVISADSRSIKVWDRADGAHFTTIESPTDINDVCVPSKECGLLFVANEGAPMHTFYVPALGPAPHWCTFLDNIVEELEENPEGETTYDDYRFVTRQELSQLNLDHLIGTNVLRAHLHGYFIDLRLYEKARAIANPFAYEEYRAKLRKEQLEKRAASRIVSLEKKKKQQAPQLAPKVNKALAERLQAPVSGDNKRARERREEATKVLQDDRFTALFDDPQFQVDEESQEYKLLRPTDNKDSRHKRESGMASDDSDRDDLRFNASEPTARPTRQDDTSDESEEEEDVPTIQSAPGPFKAVAPRPVRISDVKTSNLLSFRERLAMGQGKKQANDDAGVTEGDMESTFVMTDPKEEAKQKRELEKRKKQVHRDPKERRGIKELHLKSANPRPSYRR